MATWPAGNATKNKVHNSLETGRSKTLLLNENFNGGVRQLIGTKKGVSEIFLSGFSCLL